MPDNRVKVNPYFQGEKLARNDVSANYSFAIIWSSYGPLEFSFL